MLDIKKTIKQTTFIFIICISIIILFIIAPIIEDKTGTKYFIVTFDSGVGENYKVSVNENQPVVKPETPTREGYKFVGWYHGQREFDFTTYITKDMTLKGIWEKEEPIQEEKTHIVVTFDVKGGSLIESQRIIIGGTANIPPTPTREGYTFVEWQVDGKSYDFGSRLQKDTTIVAIWDENR